MGGVGSLAKAELMRPPRQDSGPRPVPVPVHRWRMGQVEHHSDRHHISEAERHIESSVGSALAPLQPTTALLASIARSLLVIARHCAAPGEDDSRSAR